MPHLTLEYTRNLVGLDADAALARASEAMFDSGLFSEPDIKCRARVCEHWQIGVKPELRGFVHVTITLMPGRSVEERKELSEAVLAAISPLVQPPRDTEVQFSVETVEIDRATYAKATLHG